MADQARKKNGGPRKSFMTVGPTLHYSHTNVLWCWVLSILVYAAACLFWTQVHTGRIQLTWSHVFDVDANWLQPYVDRPLSIFEYPYQILVLALLMGVIGTAPVLVAQLLSFRFSLPMILSALFLAKLPVMAACLLISCIAVACRPLRFRSRFIAIALCMAPQLVYWAVFGGGQSDPVKWGFSYAPWLGAWLIGLAMAGTVIGIGHFTRYRPGLVWTVSGIVLTIAVLVFTRKISFAELDYQLYIAGNNPEEVPEFRDHDMRPLLDQAMQNPVTKSYLQQLFYPTEPILLREELKKEIQIQLGYDRWPSWFDVPDTLGYQRKRMELLREYKYFIQKWPNSRRLPIALYFRALLMEYNPDLRTLLQREVLHFYNDYPDHGNLPFWHEVLERAPRSPEAVEARYRIAFHQAGRARFKEAIDMLDVAAAEIARHLQAQRNDAASAEAVWEVFVEPAETVMTVPKLNQLLHKVRRLRSLIAQESQLASEESRRRLAQFVILNPHRPDYADRLEELLAATNPNDPLRDNLLLATYRLITDLQLRADKLKELIEQFPRSDGAVEALYELGLLQVERWKDPDASQEAKARFLADARSVLNDLLQKHPQSIYADRAREILDGLPKP